MVRRNKYAKRGRPKKVYPTYLNYSKRLGGIPVKVKNGKVMYDYNINRSVYTKWASNKISDEEVERLNAPLPQGDGSFIRKCIYEIRFGIRNETNKERRKREYEEWWENVQQ